MNRVAGLGFGGLVEACGAEGVAGPASVLETGGGDELLHARGAGKAFDTGRKVAVGAGVAGDEAAEFGQNLFEVEGVESADEARGLVAVEDADLAAGAEDAMELGEALLVVGEVAEAEGGGDQVDGVVGEWEVEGVGLDGEDVVRGELLGAAAKHVVGEVEGEDGGRCLVSHPLR